MPTALVTGASRGLGLEHVRQFASRGWQVIACARRPDAPALGSLVTAAGGLVQAIAMDVADHDAVDRAATALHGVAIDILVNNAGTSGPGGGHEAAQFQGLQHMDYAVWRDILEINLLGAFKVATAFRDQLAASQRRLLVNVSSDLGSVAQNGTGNIYAYRTSKAGLNMMTRGMAVEWPHLVVIAVAPGWCRTDLGGIEAEVAPADSVRAQQELFERVGPVDSGRFLDRFGQVVPW